jgi:signal transduction histidine kinase
VSRARPGHRPLHRLADEVLEVPDLPALTQLLTRELPLTLEADSVTLLLWDRKLDSFETLSKDETQRGSLESGGAGAAPEARYLLSEGTLLETPSGRGDGALVPLQARSGLVGMLLIGPRKGSPVPPYSDGEVRELSALARRAALALENHLYQRELIASERLTALGTMAGMLVHDFRGPMTVIRGYAETLTDPGLTRQELSERATLITEMVDRLERMTTETLDFARGGGKLARRSIGLNRLLQTLCADLGAELPGLEVVRDIEVPTETMAALDVDKLRRAVSNIAANARDAMGGKGRFHVEARLLDLPAEKDHPPRPGLLLELRDEGPGIPPEIRERLFDPFVTRGKKGGTGLGLAVARRFIEDHGGTVALLESGPGARFRILLPLQPLQPSPEKAAV